MIRILLLKILYYLFFASIIFIAFIFFIEIIDFPFFDQNIYVFFHKIINIFD